MAGEGKSVVSLIQPTFNAGELSPLLFGRVDFEKYKSGLALARNVYVDYRGGLSNRPGTQYVANVDGTSGPPKGIPFIVNTQVAYSVVFTGNGMIQFFSNGAYVGGADLASPYAQADIPLVKWNQSADVMTLTHPLYPIYNLTRTGPSTFSLVQAATGPVMQPPTGLAGRVSTSDTNIVYTYVVTSVSVDGKEESIATVPIFVPGEGNTTTPRAAFTLTWGPPASGPTPGLYKVYSSLPFTNRGVMGTVPGNAPSVYGYIGQATATTFTDQNLTPNPSITPPVFQDPWSPGQVASVQPNSGSFTGYTGVFIAALVFTGGTPARTAAGYAIIDTASNQPIGVVLTDPGKGYASPPVVTDSVGNATYTISMGQTTGTFPGCSTYFQQRLTYGGTINFPESLVMSTPGKYTNFDTSPISLASDSVTVSISSTQNNTIVSMVPVSTGMIAFTYGSAFLITGGSQASAVTPSSIVALPQASFGASNLPPIAINYTVLYTENLGFTVRDLTFNFYYQNYVGVDRSILSSHLFFGYTFSDWAFAEAPFRLLHAVRSDGQIIVMTYVPEQEMFAWTHYDTNGIFISVWTVPEGQTNAVYAIVQRFLLGNPFYTIERFTTRIWNFVQDTWFVDAGLSLAHTFPAGTLIPSIGAGTLNATNVKFTNGSGGFVPGDVGKSIWGSLMGGGWATVTGYVAANQVLCTILQPFPLIPNSPGNVPVPLPTGQWSFDKPVGTVSGLDYLDGLFVSGIADGTPILPPQLVVAGSITLPGGPASKVVVGLPYQSQVQTLRLTTAQVGEDGKRKNIPAITLRQYQTAGVMVGKSFDVLFPQRGLSAPVGPMVVLEEGDLRTGIGATWHKDGQFVIQQSLPLPFTILADMPEVVPGDTYR